MSTAFSDERPQLRPIPFPAQFLRQSIKRENRFSVSRTRDDHSKSIVPTCIFPHQTELRRLNGVRTWRKKIEVKGRKKKTKVELPPPPICIHKY